MESDDRLLDVRLDALDVDLRSLDGVLVAFSGGADSAVRRSYEMPRAPSPTRRCR